MPQTIGYIVFFIAVAFILVRFVLNRVNKSRYEEDLDNEQKVNQAINTRLSRSLVFIGITITSGMAFIGIVVLYFSITSEARTTGKFMADIFPIIVIVAVIIIGVLGTIGIINYYNKNYE
jgi:hypothetical protein